MKITKIDPIAVIERFPSRRETIKLLLKNDPSFQTLCSDYHQCSNALSFWKKSDLCEAPQRREEYETLLHELESEILMNLDNFPKLNPSNTSQGE